MCWYWIWYAAPRRPASHRKASKVLSREGGVLIFCMPWSYYTIDHAQSSGGRRFVLLRAISVADRSFLRCQMYLGNISSNVSTSIVALFDQFLSPKTDTALLLWSRIRTLSVALWRGEGRGYRKTSWTPSSWRLINQIAHEPSSTVII